MKDSQLVAAGLTSNDALILTELGAILLFLGIISFIAFRLSISSVPLFLIVGLVFGNGGLLPLDLSGAFLNIGAQIGALLLLLLLGLEYSARELGTTLRERWSVGLVDVLANALPGAAIGLLVGWGWTGAVILSGITYVSSSGIAAELIRESGWQSSVVAKRTITVLALEDFMLAPYLPFASVLVAGASALTGFISVSVALLIVGLVLLLSVRRENLVSGLLNKHDSLSLLLTVFGAALLAAGAANLVGFSGAVAAFLIGLLLTGEVAASARHRLSPLRDFFAAIFFLFFGLSTDPSDIPAALPLALLLTVLGVLGKFFTGWWSSKDLSDQMSWRRVGAFLIPRGEFSIVIAGLAMTAEFGTDLKAVTITYVILTTVTSSLLLRTFRSRLINK